MKREQVLGVLLAVAAGLVVFGLSLVSDAAGLVAAGVLLAAWTWLFFGEVAE